MLEQSVVNKIRNWAFSIVGVLAIVLAKSRLKSKSKKSEEEKIKIAAASEIQRLQALPNRTPTEQQRLDNLLAAYPS
jgi:hypothetical protein